MNHMNTVAALALIAGLGCGSDGGPAEPGTELFELVLTVVGTGTVTSSPAALTCTPTRCSGSFESGTLVLLNADAAADHRFVALSDGCTDADGCSVLMDRARTLTVTFEPKVESNGLTREINELVPDTLIALIESLGMPIHRGAIPPALGGAFRSSPFFLVKSNVPGDPPSGRFQDYYLGLSEQDSEALTITVDYVNGPERGTGIGGFIVGEDSSFTIFATIRTVAFGDTADNLQILSGRLRAQGIDDFHAAFFMLDNHGNPHGYYIPDGTGRVIRDSDGFSERIPALPSPARLTDRLDTQIRTGIGGRPR